MRLVGTFLLMLVALFLAATSAQAREGRFVNVKVHLFCGNAQSVDGFVYPTITISGHENRMPWLEQSFSMFIGPQQLKISVSNVYPEREPKTSIREIAVVDPTGSQRTVIATPNSREASFNATVPGPMNASDSFGFDIVVDECAGKTKLQIITTSSCKGVDGEDFVIQPKTAVMIGGQEFISNDKGIIEVEVPTGRHEVSARWFDAALSYVKHDGLHVPGGSDDGKLFATLTKDRETLEVRMATCDPSGATKVRANITELGGSAQFFQGKKKGRAATAGQPLVDGDVVAINGTAVVTFVDGHIVRFEDPRGQGIIHVGPDAPYPSGTKPKEESGAVVTMIKGFIYLFTPPPSDRAKFKFEASSNSVILAYKGTASTFSHDDTTNVSTVAVYEGLVGVTPVNPALPPFDLMPGQQVSVSLDAVGPIIQAPPLGGIASGPPPLPGAAEPSSGPPPPPGSGIAATPPAEQPTSIEPPVSGAGTYLGCFADTSVFDLDGFLERSSTNTPESCVATCDAMGFPYAAVQYGESCLCGVRYGRYGASNSCDYQCTGDPGQICGGYNANSVYATGQSPIELISPPVGETTPSSGTYLGCFRDYTPDNDLDAFLERRDANTPESCVATCADMGFPYAGVQYGESCLCGTSYGRYGEADNCDFQCTGDSGQMCGGYDANSIYATGQ